MGGGYTKLTFSFNPKTKDISLYLLSVRTHNHFIHLDLKAFSRLQTFKYIYLFSRFVQGPKRATHRHGESIDLDNEGVDDYHDKLFDTAEDMTVQTAAHTKTAQPPTLETGDGEDDDDDDIDEFDSGTAFSSLHCETPIPPLPRARIPSRVKLL